MSEMSASEARADWARVLRLARAGDPVTVTQHGEPTAVVVDIVAYRQMRDLAREVMEDAADIEAARIARARVAAGDLPVPLEELARQLTELVTPAVLAEVRAELAGR
jgi:prevent-host-death family protein